MRVVTCILIEHDLWFVALAATMCVAGCLVSVGLWRRSLIGDGHNRLSWCFLTGVCAGTSIWATHFIAMLGYHSAVPVTFEATLTVASIVVAILGTGTGVALSGWLAGPAATIVGGGLFGLSVAAMHYIGMFAYRVDGIVSWDAGFIALSLFSAIGLSALAVAVMRRWPEGRVRHAGAALLVLSIVTLHFSGMAAFAVTPMPGVSVGADSQAFTAMAMAVAVAALFVVGTGVSSHLIDNRTRASSEDQLRFMASHDVLTDLSNRRHFSEVLAARCEALAGNGEAFTLFLVDLDRFKPVNDTFGHLTGDAVLARLANRLRHAAGASGLVARLGGDEFGVLADGDCPDRTAQLAERMVDMLSRPLIIDGNVIEVGASIGVAQAPRDGATPSEITQHADVALYAAKEAGRGTFRVFDCAMTAELETRRSLERELRRAAARNDFELHYQPQIDAQTGAYTGAEALIRWRHPVLGPVSPAVFIPLAEELGLISSIGTWVLQTACADAARWPEHLKIAVNLSPVQLSDPRLPQFVASTLNESGLQPGRLELEITETALVRNDEQAHQTLQKLKQLGIAISLDDFGTGYSSLSYLHRFPIDRIKIDRSFVRRMPEDIDSTSIVRAIIQLGANLGLKVTAEGIETDEQRHHSAEYGCSDLQGYLISQPVAAGQLEAIFAGGQRAEAAA